MTNIKSASFAGVRIEIGLCMGVTYAKGLETNKGEGIWTQLTILPNGQYRAKLLTGQYVFSELRINEEEGRLP